VKRRHLPNQIGNIAGNNSSKYQSPRKFDYYHPQNPIHFNHDFDRSPVDNSCGSSCGLFVGLRLWLALAERSRQFTVDTTSMALDLLFGVLDWVFGVLSTVRLGVICDI